MSANVQLDRVLIEHDVDMKALNDALERCLRQRDELLSQLAVVSENKSSNRLNESLLEELQEKLSALQAAEERWQMESREKLELVAEVILRISR